MKVYVATSWRNEAQPAVVQALRDAGHQVYDFRRPASRYEALDGGEGGFSWFDVEPDLASWSAQRYRESLREPAVSEGFERDMSALRECDAVVMVQPCGRSAALELGWAAGAGKRTVVFLADVEPELMLMMAHHFCLTMDEVIQALSQA